MSTEIPDIFLIGIQTHHKKLLITLKTENEFKERRLKMSTTKIEDIKTIQSIKLEVKQNEDVFHYSMPVGCSLGSAYDACIKCAQKIANIIQTQLQKAEEDRKKKTAPEVKQEELDKGEKVKNIGD